MSNLFNILSNHLSSFGFIEWGLIVLVAILLVTLFIFNKGALKCKIVIEQLEKENKSLKDYIFALENTKEINDERGLTND